MNVGLIGAGNISATHARAVSAIPGAQVSAVFAPSIDRARALASPYHAAAFDDFERFFAHRPMDSVVIGSPSGLHAEHGIAAARHDLHVLVEKPIDTTVARGEALVEAADRAGVTLGVIFQDRLKPDVQRASRLLDEGRLGRPILASAEVRWYRPPEYYAASRWRGTRALDGGGALMNQGVHTVDLLIWLFGSVKRVFARTATALHAIEVEDTAVATLEFENGALGTLEAATSAYPGYSRRLLLTGSEGTIVIEGDDLTAIDLHDKRSDDRVARASTTVSAASPVVADASAHVRVLEDFFRATATHSAPCCGGRDGLRSVAVIEAIYQSARTGRPIEPVRNHATL